jgi:NDP-sugar pyrophosphorylase family protein
MKAMVFAAGFGRRLLPLTSQTPKALVPVAGRPMLVRVIAHLIYFGVREVIVNTHYLHDRIAAYLGEHPFPIPVHLSYEPTILGTGGGFYQTRSFWDDSDFLLYNADIVCNADLTVLLEHHRSSGGLATLAVNRRPSRSMLLVDERGLLVGFQRNGQAEVLIPPAGCHQAVGFCGFHAVSPRIFQHLRPPVAFSIIDLYRALLRQGLSIHVWEIGDVFWEDIGTPQGLKRTSAAIADGTVVI